MMKIKASIGFSLIVLLLSACSSVPPKTEAKAEIKVETKKVIQTRSHVPVPQRHHHGRDITHYSYPKGS